VSNKQQHQEGTLNKNNFSNGEELQPLRKQKPRTTLTVVISVEAKNIK
jgi:hypothetical protein